MQKIKIIVSFVFCTVLFLVFISASVPEKTVYRSVTTSEKKIALTFDDGPHPTQTKEILDILDTYRIKATFFVVGKNIDISPEILKLTAEQGHEIGNHTYDHRYKSLKNKQNIINEINETSDLIYKTCGYKTTLFRPPGGSVTTIMKEATQKCEHKIILWNVDTKDWTHNSVEKIVKNVNKNTNNGSIILFHDYISDNTPTIEALKEIIPTLIEKGYSFCTVSELLEYEEKNTNAH